MQFIAPTVGRKNLAFHMGDCWGATGVLSGRPKMSEVRTLISTAYPISVAIIRLLGLSRCVRES